eukprot:symbB.v1.2.022802.t1/scaffold2062.1/size90804/5
MAKATTAEGSSSQYCHGRCDLVYQAVWWSDTGMATVKTSMACWTSRGHLKNLRSPDSNPRRSGTRVLPFGGPGGPGGSHTEATPRRHAPSGPGNLPACTVLGIPKSANTDMEEDVSAIEEVGPALSNFERSPLLATSLCSRSFTSFEVSNFHVASTRFWEAVLLPCAVVVVVAFSSCMELWIGQCVSLGCWYAVNYYAMGYTLQVLHPSNSSVERGLLWLSPFGGGLQLCLWSFSSAILEVILII